MKKNIRKVAIVLSGPCDSFISRKRLNKYDFIIGVDGGAKHILKCGPLPDLYIGDNDSLSDFTFDFLINNGVENLKYNTLKDKTDFELAMDYVLKNLDANLIDIYCALGAREDHTMTILNNILSYTKKYKITVYGQNQILKVLDEGDTIRIKSKDEVEYFSMVPIDEEFTVSINSAAWELDNKTVKRTSSLLMSNRIRGEYSQIKAKKNRAYLFIIIKK